ncbi:hypothetical protein [Shewanella sp. TB7-MNA-CIBAN-0143]|uniref:hypothetical protein n=1 Tax=Shewanella sp. TB7-MNA-CIBAN-0143 TaxID=3140465 RepID=UPI003323DFF4
MLAVIKRLLNVISFVALLALALFSWMMITGSIANWVVFTEVNLIPLALAFICILIVNYLAFGKVTIWHQHIK